MSPRTPFHRRVFWISLLVLPLLFCRGIDAQPCPEVLDENHLGPGTITIPGFVAGEEGAVVFEASAADYPIEILRVGIGWGSQFGGNPQSLEEAILIYEGTPPGVNLLFQLDGPLLTDGFINEFDLEPLPGDIIINSGPFVVSLLFANSSTPTGPSMVIDGAGCLPGQNYVNAAGLGWADLCTFGASGNWLMHVVYRSVNCGGGGTDPVFRRGDANSDTQFNIADPVRLLSALFSSGNPLECVDSGDSNDDGGLDIADAVAMLISIFAGGAPPPAPGPILCGPDPTPDGLDCLIEPDCT